jgi:hypothetical protein
MIRTSPILAVSALLTVLGFAANAGATTYVWDMNCSEDQVSNSGAGDGSTDSTATGHAELRYDTLTERLSYEIEWNGLVGLLSAIHVHGPAAPLANNMLHLFNVYTAEPDVIASGVDRTSGTVYAGDELVALILASGGAHSPDIALQMMIDEMAYVNIHSTMWPMGEIRCHLVLTDTFTGTEQTKAQQKCTNSLRKGTRKVAGAQAKRVASCVKEAGKNGPVGSETCVATDVGGKIGAVAAKTTAAFMKLCAGASLPAYGVTDDATVNAVSIAKDIDLAHDVFGVDLDVGLAGPGDVAKCQSAVFGAIRKCQDAKLRAYAGCTKSDLAGKVGLTVVDEYGLERCLAIDRKGKVAKACDPVSGKIRTLLDKKCAAIDLSVAFPGCALVDAESSATCLDQAVACRTCVAANAGDAIAVDCDRFDDGAVNASCVP